MVTDTTYTSYSKDYELTFAIFQRCNLTIDVYNFSSVEYAEDSANYLMFIVNVMV